MKFPKLDNTLAAILDDIFITLNTHYLTNKRDIPLLCTDNNRLNSIMN